MKIKSIWSFGCIFLSVLAFGQTRVTLIEQFSNSSCGPCGAVSPSIYNFADNNPDKTVAISYHTSFPYYNDSMYFENPTESTQRVNYYSVGSVPYTVFDGNVFSGSSSNFNTNITTNVNNRLGISPRYSIQTLSLSLNGNQLSGSFRFTSINSSNASENLIAHVVVIEKNVLKSSYAASPGNNSETEYGYVMRKMIPDASGTGLINKAMNGKDSVSFNWNLNNIKNIAELKVVIFIQNNSSKEVYQAQLFSPSGSLVTVFEVGDLEADKILVYPNPVKENLSILMDSEKFVDEIAITNQLGEIVYKQFINTRTALIQTNLDLANGIYYLRVSSDSKTVFKKKIISH